MGERVGLGFAGVGWLGESLIKELPKFPELRLAAVQDANADLAAEVAQRYACPWQGTDFDALLATPGVDAVVICTPNAFHVAQAQGALRSGKHVLVQKPLALSTAEAEATAKVADEVGKVLFVDYTYRYLATVERLYQEVAGIGRLRHIQGIFHNIYGPGKAWFFDPRLSGGGALIDLGVHLLDLALDLVRPAQVALTTADLSYDQGYAVEDTARLALQIDDVAFDLAVSWNARDRPLTEILLRVEGERGEVRWENVEGSFFHFRSLREGVCLLDRETTLREDTLRAFRQVVLGHAAPPPVEVRVYDILAAAYAQGALPARRLQ